MGTTQHKWHGICSVSEAIMLAICVQFCSCLCMICSNVSEALMLAICVHRFCCCLCKVCLHVSEAFLLALQTLSLSFLTNNSFSNSKTFLGFTVFSGRAFLFFDAKAWPQSQTHLFTCSTVLHCGQSQTSKFDGKTTILHAPSHMITHYHYVRVTERYTETLRVKRMADFIVEYKFIMLLTFELNSFRKNGF